VANLENLEMSDLHSASVRMDSVNQTYHLSIAMLRLFLTASIFFSGRPQVDYMDRFSISKTENSYTPPDLQT
jgi:hypothetical protein